MNLRDIYDLPLGSAIGAPGHDRYFKTDAYMQASIFEMAAYAKKYGIRALLSREYPDTGSKNIIVNVIDSVPCITDGNRHAAALLIAEPQLTFGRLDEYCPGIVRVWEAGVEEGKNSPDSPYDVYIPADIDISYVSGAYLGTDWFKDPPAPTNIVPANLRPDSAMFTPKDRGVPLFQTVIALLCRHISAQ